MLISRHVLIVGMLICFGCISLKANEIKMIADGINEQVLLNDMKKLNSDFAKEKTLSEGKLEEYLGRAIKLSESMNRQMSYLGENSYRIWGDDGMDKFGDKLGSYEKYANPIFDIIYFDLLGCFINADPFLKKIKDNPWCSRFLKLASETSGNFTPHPSYVNWETDYTGGFSKEQADKYLKEWKEVRKHVGGILGKLADDTIIQIQEAMARNRSSKNKQPEQEHLSE